MNAGEVGATLALDNVPTIGIDKTIMPERLRLSMAALVVTIMALAFLGGTTARYGIPILTTGAAYLLYRRAPVVYVSFVWWLFFLICLLRRVIDYRSGFSEQNVIVAAPFLASLVCLPTMLSRSDIWRLRTSLPFVLALSSSLYGFGVGALCLPKKTLLVSTLAWFSPLVFGFFLMCELTSSERCDAHIASLRQTFCWGTLLMGSYGIYQFAVAPKWDALWMTETGMGSIGSPEPFAIRVFSTMNGPGTLAYSLVAGLLLLLFRQGATSILAGGVGFITLLLSSVRAAWAALALALILMVVREKKYISKLIAGTVIVAACASAAMVIQPLRERLQDRFLSFTDMKSDTSYQERTGGYREMLAYAADAPFGSGLGAMDALFQGKTSLGTRDSGIWEVILSLGWIGGAVYFAALATLAWNSWSTKVNRSMPELLAACICIGLLCQLPMGSVVGITGVTIWIFGAVAVAPVARVEVSR